MCHLIRFECRECRIRFPAFHPNYKPDFELQITKQCRNDVAEWNDAVLRESSSTFAPTCVGLCGMCADDLVTAAKDEVKKGITRFGAKNCQDPLAGFPAMRRVDSLDMCLHDLFRQATVLEAMLVSLNHMQVSVCTFSSREDSRTGLSRFRKNIISFPQHVSDLQQHMSFVESIEQNQVINVALTEHEYEIVRARVVNVLPGGFFDVEIADHKQLIRVAASKIRSRLRLPWKPRDLQHALIVLRRRSGNKTEFVEDLRVRRPFVVALLRALSERGQWREHRDVEPMHMYYTEFDWLTQEEIEEVLPENDLPDTLVIQDLTNKDEPTGLTCSVFQEWLHEGKQDCDTAKTMLRFWHSARQGSINDATADLFHQLYLEFIETLPADDRRRKDEDGELPVTRLAEVMHVAGYVTFDCSGLEEADIRTRICADILEEVAKIQAYLAAWRGSTVVAEPERQGVAEATEEACRDAVRPWPKIEKEPVSMSEEGRFVKAFPLEFPMGVGDFRQPQLRDDFNVMEWIQHKFRYVDGRFVSSGRGHRVTWAIFDTGLLDSSRGRAHAYYTASDSRVLTKRALKELVESRDDLVRQMASHGSEIPTTPMFWKRITAALEWIVRQMSWFPPWLLSGDSEMPVADPPPSAACPAADADMACVQYADCEEMQYDETAEKKPTSAPSVPVPEEPAMSPASPKTESDVDEKTGAATAKPKPARGAPAERVWSKVVNDVARRDDHGYGRIPAFWFTLNCPYNYLHEIHRFHGKDGSLRGNDPESKRMRVQWCYDNPDLVCFLHALRVELLVRMVMPTIVPTSAEQPFQYWVRFEEGTSGNPHAHGLSYAAGNPSLCGIESLTQRSEGEMPEEDKRVEMAQKLAEYFSEIASEWHPAKDGGNNTLYDFVRNSTISVWGVRTLSTLEPC